VDIVLVEESELDEMWSYVGNKKNRHWLWHAIDHKTGEILAYTFGTQEDKVFKELKNMLEPFSIKTYYTDGNPTYSRLIKNEKHIIGKKNTQRIERKHLTLRTRIKRLVRKTICFSKSVLMHEIVVGLFINITEFGLAI
jgi:insertion element IS1 protein InsB